MYCLNTNRPFILFDDLASNAVSSGHQAALSIFGIFRNLSICRDRSPGDFGKTEAILSLVPDPMDKFAEFCRCNLLGVWSGVI